MSPELTSTRVKHQGRPEIPRVTGLPGLGVLPQVWRDMLGFFLKAGAEHPVIVKIDLGPARFHLISHPDSVQYVLQDNHRNYVKGYNRVKPLLGEGLVTSEGELWRRQRHLMQPAFLHQHLGGLLPIMTNATGEMLARWRNRRGADEPMNIAREIILLTQTIILRTMFSTDIGGRADAIADAFAAALDYLNLAIIAPFPILRSLPTPANRRFRQAMHVLDAAVYQIISERRETGARRNDLLQMLIDARDEETGQGMSDRQMRDEVMTIFLAGHETTAALLGWTFYLLGQHPAVEERVRAELEQVISGPQPSYEEIGRLEYTSQVLNEALRLYPPAWMFARKPIEDDEIGGYPIPAGSLVMLSPYVTHHLPQFWPNPDRFDPGRFSPELENTRPHFAYFPFGGGPRMCIGKHFALLEAPALLAMILRNFKITPAPGCPVRAQPAATLRPRPGVYVNIKPI